MKRPSPSSVRSKKHGLVLSSSVFEIFTVAFDVIH